MSSRLFLPVALPLALITSFLGACAGTNNNANIVVASTVPAAQGELKVRDAGNNTSIDLSVRHLAPPERISPQASTYVVWARPLADDTGRAQNLGALSVDRNLSGRLRSTTPLKQFELFVTAESSTVAEAPTGERVMSAMVTR